jgi:hypothetical protein
MVPGRWGGFVESKRAHLQMLQAVITRMSTDSFLLKGWSVLLVSALFALAAGGSQKLFVYLAYFPGVAFWLLDAYYLRQERLFRRLYDRVRNQDEADVDFSMNTTVVEKEVDSWLGVAFSVTVATFHGAVIGSILVVMLVLVFVR